jgi:hypothetical protein
MHTTESKGGDLKESISLSDEQKEELRGIVYYQGDVTADDLALENDYPECTHGLIVALSNAGSECYWQSTPEWVYDTFQKTSDTYSGYKEVSVTLYEDYFPTDYSGIYNAKLGYNNTVVLRAYNESKISSSESNKIVIPVANIDALTNKAPAGSSGWYFPSPLELALLSTNRTTEVKFLISIEGSEVRTQLNKIFDKLSALDIIVSEISENNQYWSSLEVYMAYWGWATASYVRMYNDSFIWNYELTKTGDYSSSPCMTRAICAY